jgi:hypothetical protein
LCVLHSLDSGAVLDHGFATGLSDLCYDWIRGG